MGSSDPKVIDAFVPRRGGLSARFRPCRFLHRARGVRTALGQYRSSTFARTTPIREFPVYHANDPEHTFFNYIASTIAVAIIAFTGIAAIAVHKDLNQPDATQQRRHLWALFSYCLRLRPR